MPAITKNLCEPLTGGVQLGDGRRLRALGLWPMYGTAIATDKKTNETRSWYRGFTGPLAIYQTKGVPAEAKEAYEELQSWTRNRWTEEGTNRPFDLPPPDECPRAAIVAVCRVVTGVAMPRFPQAGQIAVRFFDGAGRLQERLLPPERDTSEGKLGFYQSDEYETRYAWVLTDVYAPPKPVPLPPGGGGTRQGIFDVPAETALPLLASYREYLLNLRPRCQYCDAPIGSDTWQYSVSGGWKHTCFDKWGRQPIPGDSALRKEDRSALVAFREGYKLPVVPSGPLEAALLTQDACDEIEADKRAGKPANLTLF